MVVRHRKKSSRQRAGTTHGYGSMKKNRGAGNRGGVGNAGSGKRGDANKPRFWNDKKKFGMHGFTSKSTKKLDVTMNVSDLMVYVAKTGKTDINLLDLKVTKLLGSGKVTQAVNVIVNSASAKAIMKIEEAKGSIKTLSAEVESTAKDKTEE